MPVLWLVFLIVLSAFFSGCETAFTNLSHLRIAHMIKEKRRNAELIKSLKDREHQLLITVLVGNNIVNMSAAALAAVVALEAFGNAGVGVVTAIMTFIILTFGEIIPKTLALKKASLFAQFGAWPIYVLLIVLKPLVIMFEYVTKGVGKIFGIKDIRKQKFSEPLLMTAVSESEKEGSIKKIEKEIITNVFKFDKVLVKEIMIPRSEMAMISSDRSITEALNFMMDVGHSRVPVYEKKQDNIIGIAYVKDLIRALKDNNMEQKVKILMRGADFVPETKMIDTLLTEFQKKKSQIAIVVDEHGQISGLVTFEDILEEIVGEIYDESDKDKELIKKTGKKEYIVKAKTPIDIVNGRLRLGIELSEDYATIGGYVLHHLGKIPKLNEEIETKKFRMIIDNMIKHRIITLRVVKK